MSERKEKVEEQFNEALKRCIFWFMWKN